MRSSLSRSVFSAAVWFYLGPFVAIGGLALLIFGFGMLALAFHALAVLLKHAGI